jgi:NitT/TauT family transport system substrate-binding protein
MSAKWEVSIKVVAEKRWRQLPPSTMEAAMTRPMFPDWTRRATLGGLAASSGAGLIGFGWESAAAEAPPETRKIRIMQDEGIPVLCWAPQYLAIEFLRMEGFEEIELIRFDATNNAMSLVDGTADFAVPLSTDIAIEADRGGEITLLSGLHVGCVEVFASERVKSITDLRGARLAADGVESDARRFLSAVVAYVGLDPERDVEWVYGHARTWAEAFADGEVDVVRAFPPMTYDLHELGFGHVIMNTTLDDPWRNFYCCMIAAQSDFVRRYPVATKRALRAYAKAQQACANDRERSARLLVELGATERLDYARRVVDEVPYGAWREYDPAASLRFFALRLREAGFIKESPGALVDRVADTSFWNELRTELKT